MKKLLTYCILLLCLVGCGKKTQKQTNEPLTAAAFSADSAYRYISEQVAFGARVPGTPAHEDCCRWLRDQLRNFGAEVQLQQGALPNYEGRQQQIVNIVGRYGAHDAQRILLCAHWDCRPWCDQEEEYSARMTPVTGANDGASGVGVLLEIARQLQILEAEGQSIPAVDIVFFDVEDMGTPDFYTGQQRENSWCLGSQLWAASADRKDYKYGILLDMIASPDASFGREYFSTQYAGATVNKVWRTAEQLGYSRFFQDRPTHPLTDDHYYVNSLAGIPCIDIIHYSTEYGTGFPEYWHTQHDDMRNVSPVTLDAVGKTVLTTILH